MVSLKQMNLYGVQSRVISGFIRTIYCCKTCRELIDGIVVTDKDGNTLGKSRVNQTTIHNDDMYITSLRLLLLKELVKCFCPEYVYLDR